MNPMHRSGWTDRDCRRSVTRMSDGPCIVPQRNEQFQFRTESPVLLMIILRFYRYTWHRSGDLIRTKAWTVGQ